MAWKSGFFLILITAVAVTLGQAQKLEEGNLLKTPPVPELHRFIFGFAEPTSDLLWLQSIQGFDYCESEIAERTCIGKGWLFQMLDTVTNLSPHFRMPYATGGLALTVIISDYAGASIIFDKGVKAFPNDWPILYRAAYHALYEEKDNLKAANLLWQAAKNGAPDWLYSLATRLYSEEGQKEVAQRLFDELKQSELDPAILKKIKAKLLEKQAK